MYHRRSPLVLAALAAAALAFGAAAPASAQIVNVQPLVEKGGEGFSGQASGSLTWRTGNVDLLLAKGELLLLYQLGVHKLISSSKAEIGIKSGDEFLERIFSHLRHQAILGWGFTWETYAQVATDRFKRLALRALAGTGPRYDIVEGPAVGLAVGLSYMFEREVLNETSFADSGRADNNHRLSTYLTGKFVLDPLITLIHTTYFQPGLSEDFDFRVSSETDLAFKLNTWLSLTVGFDVAYDSSPPIDVDALDTSTSVALGVTF